MAFHEGFGGVDAAFGQEFVDAKTGLMHGLAEVEDWDRIGGRWWWRGGGGSLWIEDV